MPSIGELLVDLRVDASDVSRDVKRETTKAATEAGKQFDRIEDDAEKSFKEVGNAAKVAGAAVAAAFVAGTAALLKGGLREASDLGESINAVNVILEDGAQQFLAFGENAADAMGLTQSALNNLAIPIAAVLGNAFEGNELSTALEDLAVRASDVGSVFNTEVNEVLDAFGAALRGEAEPARRFGIQLDAARIKAVAYAEGIAQVGDELTQAQKVQAAYQIVLDDTAKSAGDFANTQDSLANAQRRLTATGQEFLAVFGEGFIGEAGDFLAVLAGGFAELRPQVEAAGLAIGAAFAEFGPEFAEGLVEFSSVAIDLFGSVVPALISTFGKLTGTWRVGVEVLGALTPLLDVLATVLASLPEELIQVVALSGAFSKIGGAVSSLIPLLVGGGAAGAAGGAGGLLGGLTSISGVIAGLGGPVTVGVAALAVLGLALRKRVDDANAAREAVSQAIIDTGDEIVRGRLETAGFFDIDSIDQGTAALESAARVQVGVFEFAADEIEANVRRALEAARGGAGSGDAALASVGRRLASFGFADFDARTIPVDDLQTVVSILGGANLLGGRTLPEIVGSRRAWEQVTGDARRFGAVTSAAVTQVAETFGVSQDAAEVFVNEFADFSQIDLTNQGASVAAILEDVVSSVEAGGGLTSALVDAAEKGLDLEDALGDTLTVAQRLSLEGGILAERFNRIVTGGAGTFDAAEGVRDAAEATRTARSEFTKLQASGKASAAELATAENKVQRSLIAQLEVRNQVSSLIAADELNLKDLFEIADEAGLQFADIKDEVAEIIGLIDLLPEPLAALRRGEVVSGFEVVDNLNVNVDEGLTGREFDVLVALETQDRDLLEDAEIRFPDDVEKRLSRVIDTTASQTTEKVVTAAQQGANEFSAVQYAEADSWGRQFANGALSVFSGKTTALTVNSSGRVTDQFGNTKYGGLRDADGGIHTGAALASGGIVKAPGRYWVGEAGPEAVIPLTRPKRAAAILEAAGLTPSAAGGVNATFNISAPVDDPSLIAAAVVDRLAAAAAF